MPIDFAPSIARHGREDIRFAPGFMDAGSPNFWSYAFVWRTDDDRALDAATLSADLKAYFEGLTKKPATVSLSDELRGDIAIEDPFTTHRPVTLHARITVTACGEEHMTIFELSPAASDAAIWTELAREAAVLTRCE